MYLRVHIPINFISFSLAFKDKTKKHVSKKRKSFVLNIFSVKWGIVYFLDKPIYIVWKVVHYNNLIVEH